MTEYRKGQCERLLVFLAGQDSGMTRKAAAVHLGLAKSKHVTDLINELVSRGLAQMKRSSMPNGLPVFIYFATNEGIEQATLLIKD